MDNNTVPGYIYIHQRYITIYVSIVHIWELHMPTIRIWLSQLFDLFSLCMYIIFIKDSIKVQSKCRMSKENYMFIVQWPVLQRLYELIFQISWK